MPRTLTIAAVQMDANPAPTPVRLGRAQRLVEQAAAAGAQLVALPELFHVGYAYSDSVHARAEALDGPTLAWMHQTAARLGIHLAGSLLLRDGDEVYNTLFLVAPDGRAGATIRTTRGAGSAATFATGAAPPWPTPTWAGWACWSAGIALTAISGGSTPARSMRW